MAQLRTTLRRFVRGAKYCWAAKRLNCSNAHVSRQLKQLEEILSVQLIQRTTRQFNLTYDGLRFYQQVKQLLEGAEQIN
ncbi:LysR family transcriptional regulator, partial [Escherichia coli]|nr:LysR family transcriptional regulator [Escherichia coli]